MKTSITGFESLREIRVKLVGWIKENKRKIRIRTLVWLSCSYLGFLYEGCMKRGSLTNIRKWETLS